MVLLTATPSVVAAIDKCRFLATPSDTKNAPNFASLEGTKLGDPVSHEQLVQISKLLKSHYGKRPHSNEATEKEGEEPVAYHLNDLLRGSQIYVPPPKPKPEPTPEYKALMARLRAEEERKAYERLINPPEPDPFSHRFPSSKNPFAIPKRAYATEEDDDVTFADIDRQLSVILNILVSVIACAGGIWVIARYWDTPTRLFLSMGGGILVGVAEVVIYTGYLRRVKEAKEKERKIVEKKEILDTWVIEPRQKGGEKHTSMEVLGEDVRDLRNRKSKK